MEDYRLFKAVIKNDLQAIENAIPQSNSDATLKRYDLTLIHAAICAHESDEKSYKKLTLLLKRGTQFPNEQAIDAKEGVHTPVCSAIQQGKLKCLELLMKHQAQFIACYQSECQGPLLQAIALHSKASNYPKAIHIVEYLLSKPEAKKIPRRVYSNALIALTHCHPTSNFYVAGLRPIPNPHITALLLCNKLEGDLDIPDTEGHSALHHSIKNKHSQSLSLLEHTLIQAGANVNHQNKYNGNTPLHSLCERLSFVTQGTTITDIFDKTESIRELISTGADLSIKNKANKTPFELLASAYQASIRITLNHYITALTEILKLKKPDGLNDMLWEDTEKMLVDLWRRLGLQNQKSLCGILELKHPETPPENKLKKRWSFIKKETSYLCTNMARQFTIPEPPPKKPTIICTRRFPQEIESLIINAIFEDTLIEQDYSLLGIPPQTQQEISLTPIQLRDLLLQILPKTLKPDDEVQNKTSKEIAKGLRP